MNYRQKRGAYLNCEKFMFFADNSLGFPSIRPVDVNVEGLELVGFNYAKGCKDPEDKILHFYVDDYQFERVWNDPDRYISMLKKFRAVLQPDFSIYDDFPRIVNMFNHYRKQWCSAYWQVHGIEVIPTLCWGDEESYNWCFEGVPKHSLVSVSTVGGFGNHVDNKASWLKGFYDMLEIVQPSEILLFGKEYPEIKFDGPVVVAPNTNIQRMRALSKESMGEVQIPVVDLREIKANE